MKTLHLDLSQESTLSANRHIADFVPKSNALPYNPLSTISWTTLDGESWETNPSYSHIEIQDGDLLIEDALDEGDQNDGDISYHIVPLNDIKTITHNY